LGQVRVTDGGCGGEINPPISRISKLVELDRIACMTALVMSMLHTAQLN